MKSQTLNKVDRLWMFPTSGKRVVTVAIVLMAVGAFILSLIPFILGKFFDFENVTEDDTPVFVMDNDAVFFVVLILFIFTLVWFLTTYLGKKMLYTDIKSGTIRDALAKKSKRLSVTYLEDRQEGDITALIANDVPVVHSMMTQHLPNAITQFAMIVIIVVMMALSSIWLALIYFVLLAITTIITSRIAKSVSKDLENRQRSFGKLNGFFADVVCNSAFIRIYNLKSVVESKFKIIDFDYNRSYIRTASAYGYVGPISRVIDNSGFFITAILGVMMIATDMLSVGMFMAFISYATIIGGPIVSYSASVNMIQSGMASYDRVFEYLDMTENVDDSEYEPVDKTYVRGSIVFDNVSFEYEPGIKTLDRISFSIEPETSIAIVGTGGSGKSTLSDLLLGFKSPTEGSVQLDGKEIGNIKRSDLRKVVGISREIPWIFDGTVAENLSVTASREDIERMSRITGLDEFVSRMPDGYDTKLTISDAMLHDGVRQLLAVTRLMLADPKVLIFDEAASELDPITCDRLFRNIGPFLNDKTVITISNNVYLVTNCDYVLYLDKGHIVDFGVHEELMERCDMYAELFRNMTL